MRLLYLDLDTLRPDHLGCYGYHRDTSPNLDRIAREGMRFTNYHCSDAPCLPSRTAMLTGRFGIHNGVVNHGGCYADLPSEGPERSFQDTLEQGGGLWSMLRGTGLRTVSISPFAARHAAWWFYAGFDEMVNTGNHGNESAEAITPHVLDWIERNAEDDNWCLHVNYWDSHTPYRAPEEFGNPFADDPLPAWLTEDVVAGWKDIAGGHSPYDIAMWDDTTREQFPRHPGKAIDMDGARACIDGYDCGTRYMDGHIGQLLDKLEEKGVLEDLIIIVSSDHGENMGELGIMSEHGSADAITTRIPMIIRWPGKVAAGSVDEGLHYNIDLMPTLAEMLGATTFDRWDGASYADALTGKGDAGRDQLVLSALTHSCQRSVRWDDYIYIRTWHDFYHFFPQEMVFNLKDDPHEQHNLAEERPDLCAEGARRYLAWHDEMMASSPRAEDPLWGVMHEGGPFHCRGALPDYADRLEATGRGWAAKKLRERYPELMK